MSDSHDLQITLKSSVPIIVIETQEERRVQELLIKIALKLFRPMYCWSIVKGLRNLAIDHEGIPGSENPKVALREVEATNERAIYIFFDLHPYLKEDDFLVRQLKEIAIEFENNGKHLILISHEFTVPPELKPYRVKFPMKLPNDDQIRRIILEEIRDWTKQNNGRSVKTGHKVIAQLVRNLRGLSHSETRRLARGLIVDDGAITVEDVEKVNKAKAEILDLEGALQFESDTAKFSDVAGLKKLKEWMQIRQPAILTENGGGDRPKGVMLLGIQGSGKSLAAKAVAGVLKVPLLRLDIGSLYNKFIGESEANVRKALRLADTMAPTVLWIDEIEKGLANKDSDDSVGKRLIGTLLTWMSERTSSVFIVATSNDVTQLPPELLRKGRFDEIFFVDLPDGAIRMEIFNIHLMKRGYDGESFDLHQLSRLTDGFSGAEIEAAVVAAIFMSRAESVELSDELIKREIERTSPLSVVMAEQLHALRHWAKERTVFAD